MPAQGKQAALLERIRQMLWREWDPIGINHFPAASDEYDAYAIYTGRLVLDGSDYDEIVAFLWWVETEELGLKGDRLRTEAFARRLHDLETQVDRDGFPPAIEQDW